MNVLSKHKRYRYCYIKVDFVKPSGQVSDSVAQHQTARSLQKMSKSFQCCKGQCFM